MKRDIFAPDSKSWILFYPLQTKGMMGTSSCLGYPLVQPKVNALGTSPASDPVVCRLIKCLQGVLWCSLFSGPSFCACTFFFDIIFWRCCLFLFPVHDLKGRVVALCRQRAPLMLALQPVMNSIPLYLFCAFFWLLSDVRNSAMTQNIMCAACAFYAPKRSLLVICRVIPRKKKKTFQGHLFCMTKLQPNYGHVGDMGCIFCGKMGMCVQQPWQSIGLWSVADRFLSTFSFILICAPSLSPSHAENEVSRLETAPQPTCQISLFSLPVPFLRQTLSLLQTRRKSLPLGICIPSP